MVLLAALGLAAVVNDPVAVLAQANRSVEASDEAIPCSQAEIERFRDLYRRGFYGRIVEFCRQADAGALDREPELVLLRSLARSGGGFEAVERAEALLESYGDDPAVRATAATVYLSVGRIEDAVAEVEAALAVDSTESEAWLARAMLDLTRHDGASALVALGEASRADPRLRGAYTTHLHAIRAAQAVRDPQAVVRVLDERARHLEDRGLSADDARDHAAVLRAGAGSTLFAITTEQDLVSLPFERCWPGSPYRCVSLLAGEDQYRVLLDTGNRPGWTVHAPELLETLSQHLGAPSTISTGSVDTLMASRRLMTERIALGGAVIESLPGYFFPKPREPYFDANLNPFFLQDRVVTMDHVHGRVLLRTKDRFDRDMAAADPSAVARVPIYGTDWGFIPIQVNNRPAWAMVETGAEIFQLSREFAERADIELAEATMIFRGREIQHHTAGVEVLVGGLPFFTDTVNVWPADLQEPSLAMPYEAMIGPGALEGRFALSYDPFDRMVVIERAPLR